ncbi:CBS domain-containing protein [Haloactinopolyspora sp.]|uniref:CBS domain-containing protein n=1 Tax=Haloactinopolyspora sp. TaxID=1966353 RepID=UPI00260A9764|nr:CBS domain-containing protein [Haloactinopolyspora sp.]
MKARDIVVQIPTVTLKDPVAKAVRVMTQEQLPGLIVVDENSKPRIVIPGTQVLRMAVLHSYQDDPALARTIDEAHADRFWQDLGNRTVGECLPGYPAKPVTASLDATLLELATLMGRLHSPLVAIVDHTHALVGAVTLNRLLINLALPDLDN